MTALLTAIFAAISNFVLRLIGQRQSDQDKKEIGRLEAERDQAVEGKKASDDMLDASVNGPKTVQDAIDTLRRNDG